MRADRLDVIAVYNNPQRWESRRRLFREFIERMKDAGVRLTIVEAAYGDCSHEFCHLKGHDHVNVVQVTCRTQIWIKENLLQLGLQALPRDWKYVAWIDGDIVFRHKHWATEVIHALQHYDIIQPWEHCYDLGPNGRAHCRTPLLLRSPREAS